MTTRRFTRAGLAIGVAALAALTTQLPATAQTATGKTQEVRSRVWLQPVPDNTFNDGLGTWIYVAPEAPASAGQLSPDSYEYLMTMEFDHLRFGYFGLATGTSGKVARLSLDGPVSGPSGSIEVPYDWSPGRFYFLYTHQLTGTDWGAWVMDWATGVWTYVGTIRTPDWGQLVKPSLTMVRWAPAGPRPADCSGFPRTDAYIYATLGYSGSQFTIAPSSSETVLTAGDCPTQTEILPNGWAHFSAGVSPG
jgi:hypothetical protein